MDLEKTIELGIILLFGTAVMGGLTYGFENLDKIEKKIKNFNGRRRIKKGLPPYNKEYEYGQLYLDFMKDRL